MNRKEKIPDLEELTDHKFKKSEITADLRDGWRRRERWPFLGNSWTVIWFAFEQKIFWSPWLSYTHTAHTNKFTAQKNTFGAK